MSILIENILNGNYINAQRSFFERMDYIKESKMLEVKKQVSADMYEAFGGLTLAQIQARKELGWKKASDVLGDPAERRGKLTIKAKPKKKVVTKKKNIAETTVNRSEIEAEKAKLLRSHPYAQRIAAGMSDAGKEAETKKVTPKKHPKKVEPKADMSALKKSISTSIQKAKAKSGYEDTPTGRNRQRADTYAAKHPPGSFGVSVGKLSKKIGVGILKDIGSSIG